MSHTKRKSRWMFWVLLPFLLLFIMMMTLITLIQWNWITLGMTVILNSLCIAAIFAFYDPDKFRFAWRYAGFVVFCFYLIYFLAMLIIDKGDLKFASVKSETTTWNALSGLFIYGIPGLAIAVYGKLPSWFRDHEKGNSTENYNDDLGNAAEKSDERE